MLFTPELSTLYPDPSSLSLYASSNAGTKSKVRMARTRRILVSTMASSCPMQLRGPLENGIHASLLLFVVLFSEEAGGRWRSGSKTCGLGQYFALR